MKTEEEIRQARKNLLTRLYASSVTKITPDPSDVKMIASLAAFDWILGTNSVEELFPEMISDLLANLLKETQSSIKH